MIEFSFKLSDADAENLFNCIRMESLRSRELAIRKEIEGNAQLAEAYSDDAEYMEGLCGKLTHKRVIQ